MTKKKSRLDKIGDVVNHWLPVALVAAAFAIIVSVIFLVASLDNSPDVTVVHPPDIVVQPTPRCEEDEVLTFGGECKHIETFETEVLIPIPVSQDEMDRRNELKGTPPAPVEELPETGRDGR